MLRLLKEATTLGCQKLRGFSPAERHGILDQFSSGLIALFLPYCSQDHMQIFFLKERYQWLNLVLLVLVKWEAVSPNV